MNKITVAVLACLAVGSVGVANASQTVSVGYAQTHASQGGVSTEMPGFNVKYHWENDNNGFGVIGSYAYTQKTVSDGDDSQKLTYSSLTGGPSYRFSEFVNIYALIGGAYGKIETGNGWEDSTAFAYGAGVQINPTENVAIDFSYVQTEFSSEYGNGSISAGTMMLGVGYRF